MFGMIGMPWNSTTPDFAKIIMLEEELEYTKQQLAETEEACAQLLKQIKDLEIRYNAAMGDEASIRYLANRGIPILAKKNKV